jgi:hypothetical protein
MENFEPYIISEVDRKLDSAANLPTAYDVAQRYADQLGHRVYIVGHSLRGTISVEPRVDTTAETV